MMSVVEKDGLRWVQVFAWVTAVDCRHWWDTAVMSEGPPEWSVPYSVADGCIVAKNHPWLEQENRRSKTYEPPQDLSIDVNL